MKVLAAFLALCLASLVAIGATVEDYAAKVAPQIDPALLKSVAKNKTKERVRRVTYWLVMAKRDGHSISNVAEVACNKVGMTNRLAIELTRARMLANVESAELHGCVDDAGMYDMRRGQAPTIRRGTSVNDELSVDHVLPLSVLPEGDHIIANLALMPQRLNSSKSARIDDNQRAFAARLHAAGLLSREGLVKVQATR